MDGQAHLHTQEYSCGFKSHGICVFCRLLSTNYLGLCISILVLLLTDALLPPSPRCVSVCVLPLLASFSFSTNSSWLFCPLIIWFFPSEYSVFLLTCLYPHSSLRTTVSSSLTFHLLADHPSETLRICCALETLKHNLREAHTLDSLRTSCSKDLVIL